MGDNIRIGFIGAGKVGCSLGKMFSVGGLTVAGYYSRTFLSACEGAAFTQSEAFETLEQVVAASDVLFLTTPDAVLRNVYHELKSFDVRGKQLCHCSGSLSAVEVFDDAEAQGASCYSIHPLFPVSSKTECYEELTHAHFCIEGDEAHLMDWKRRLEALGPHVQVIAAAAKRRYHAACCIPSNFVCALVQQSIDMLVACGFEADAALSALAPLMTANMEHIIKVGPQDALTGPVERNDVGTVDAHLKCMDGTRERDAYRLLSMKLVELATMRHPGADYSQMRLLLEGEES